MLWVLGVLGRSGSKLQYEEGLGACYCFIYDTQIMT